MTTDNVQKDTNIQGAILCWAGGGLTQTFHTVVSRWQFVSIIVSIKQLTTLAKTHLEKSQLALYNDKNDNSSVSDITLC